MARLIDADVLVRDINADPYRTESEKSYDRCLVYRQPNVDAVPVVHGRWIPVTERLPEQNGRYLCNVKSFAFPGKTYQAILMCDKLGFREGNIYTDDVTHWMPLPEPPKEVVG